jgi:lipopolysaccharide export system permease protein
MGRTRRYILGTFAKNYLLVFLPFLLIVSIVFVIQLSVLSSRVNIGFGELAELFGFMLPEIFFYTIPFSLIAALANTFTRFSEENEFIALFSLGHTPGKVLKSFLPTLTLFSLLLLTLSVMLYPQMKQKINHFKSQKIAEATLNIAPNKLSQSFGNFHVFVEAKREDGDGYLNMVLFNKEKKGKYQLFIAKEGTVENDGKRFTLILKEGTGETSDAKKVETLDYRELHLFQYPRSSYENFLTSWEYWQEAKTQKKRRGKLLYLIFVSLSPLLGFGLLASMTFFNPRYQRSLSTFVIFVVALAIYIPAAILQKTGSIPLFILLLVGMIALGYYLVRRKILRHF